MLYTCSKHATDSLSIFTITLLPSLVVPAFQVNVQSQRLVDVPGELLRSASVLGGRGAGRGWDVRHFVLRKTHRRRGIRVRLDLLPHRGRLSLATARRRSASEAGLAIPALPLGLDITATAPPGAMRSGPRECDSRAALRKSMSAEFSRGLDRGLADWYRFKMDVSPTGVSSTPSVP